MRTTYRTSRRRFLTTTVAVASVAFISRHRPVSAAEGDLIVRSQEPYNAEPPLASLVADPITPVKHFYVRNHGPIPKIDAESYKLRIEGMVETPLELSLAEIQRRFPR